MRYSLHMYHAYFLMMFLVHKLGFKRFGSVFQWVFNVREWFHEVSNSVTWVFLIFMFGTTLLIFCTKCEGKFVPVAPTSKMLLSMCSVLAWAGGRAGILTDSWQLSQPIRGKLRFWKNVSTNDRKFVQSCHSWDNIEWQISKSVVPNPLNIMFVSLRCFEIHYARKHWKTFNASFRRWIHVNLSLSRQAW